jgi:two-component system, NarL family, response regulator YdfI
VLRRDELEGVVRANSQFRLVGAVLGMSAVTMRTRALRPDVVLFDLPDPQSAFPALAADLEQAGAAVVVLVEEPDTNWAAHAVRSGVRALLPRDASPADIHSAIEVAHRGMLLLDPELAQGLLASTVRVHSSENAPAMMEDLTPREVEVLRMMAEGLGNKEIAARLSISDHTVKFHISSILAKLGASTRTEAVTTGIRMGLVLL